MGQEKYLLQPHLGERNEAELGETGCAREWTPQSEWHPEVGRPIHIRSAHEGLKEGKRSGATQLGEVCVCVGGDTDVSHLKGLSRKLACFYG